MKIHGDISINGKKYEKGTSVPWLLIYPFFLLHMLMFGGSGFFMAYTQGGPPVFFLYLHGGFAIAVYTAFYFCIFGRDEVRWMLINAGLGFLGICSEIGWLLSLFGKKASDYPFYVHAIPFLYYILYTFLIRQAVLDLMNAREDPAKRKRVESAYVVVSVVIYGLFYFLGR